MKTREKLCSLLAGIFTVLIVIPITWMLVDRTPPYEYDQANSYILPDIIRPGSQVTVRWAFSRINRLCPGTTERTIVDVRTGALVSYDPAPHALTIRPGDKFLERSFYIPLSMEPGRKAYRARATFVCNPLQHLWPIVVQRPDLYFEVTK